MPAAAMVLAVGFLSFVAGSFLTFTGAFPANHLTDAFRGGQALLAQQTEYDTGRALMDRPAPAEAATRWRTAEKRLGTPHAALEERQPHPSWRARSTPTMLAKLPTTTRLPHTFRRQLAEAENAVRIGLYGDAAVPAR